MLQDTVPQEHTKGLSLQSGTSGGDDPWAVMGLLLAPQSGEETREMLAKNSEELKNKAEKTVKEIQGKAEDIVSEMQKKGDDIMGKIQDMINKQKEA